MELDYILYTTNTYPYIFNCIYAHTHNHIHMETTAAHLFAQHQAPTALSHDTNSYLLSRQINAINANVLHIGFCLISRTFLVVLVFFIANHYYTLEHEKQIENIKKRCLSIVVVV